mgnify:CR=1 FL=1
MVILFNRLSIKSPGLYIKLIYETLTISLAAIFLTSCLQTASTLNNKDNIKANKEVAVFNERSGETMKFSGLEADDAQRLCSKYNLEQPKPYDEIKALDRLKKEAASIGANGVVIQKISTNIKQHLSLNENDKGEKGKGKRRKGKSDTIGRERRTEKQKELNAIAIFVK